MKVNWSPEALDDLVGLHEYISTDNPDAADRVVDTIVDFAEKQLDVFPRSGHQGRLTGTHELNVPRLPYIIPYRIAARSIEILRVYHTARRWPDVL